MFQNRSKSSQKLILDYNLPFQNNNSFSVVKFALDEQRRSIIINQEKDDITSRSNSIQGRKLSFCDPQITVSQHTLETIATNVGQTHRDRETISQHPINEKQQYESFVMLPSNSEGILNMNIPQTVVEFKHAQSRGLNPRQSKGPAKKKKRQPQIGQNSIKLQNAIKQHFKVQQQSQRKKSQSRTPLKEHKHSQYSNNQENKSGQNKIQQPASFLLTFNRDEDSTKRSKEKQIMNLIKKGIGKENKQAVVTYDQDGGIVNIYDNHEKLRQMEEERLRRQLLQNSSGRKKRPKSSQDKKYQSPSPIQKMNYVQQQHSFCNNRQSQDPSQMKSYIGSGEKDSPNRRSIDKLVKDNLKKAKEQERKQQEQLAQKREQESLRRQQIDSKNKQIREQNLQKNIIKLQKQVIKIHSSIDQRDKPSKQQNKSPLRIMYQQENNNNKKNRDMPLKIEHKRNKQQLGLEVFDVKRELGLGGNILKTIEREMPSNRPKSQLKNQKEEEEIEHMKGKHIQPNPKLQKLIAAQQKMRMKKEKAVKMNEQMEHFRVIENLKNLNRVISQQKLNKKKQNKSTYFKTAQEQDDISQEILDKHIKSKDKKSDIKLIKKNESPNEKRRSVSGRRSAYPAQSQREKLLPKQQQPSKVIFSYVNSNNNISNQNKSLQSFGKKKKYVKSKSKLINILMKQMEEQAENAHEIQPRKKKVTNKSLSKQNKNIQKQQKSIDSSQKQNNKITIKMPSSSQSPTRSMKRSQTNKDQIQSQQEDVVQYDYSQQDSEQIQIDDEMMIFCVLTTAASIIQRNFRNYLSRKQQKLQIQQQQQKELQRKHQQLKEQYSQQQYEQQDQQDSLQDSALLENRLLPSEIKTQQTKKITKHTFSFGNYEVPLQQQQLVQVKEETFSVEESRPQFQNMPNTTQNKIQKEEEKEEEQDVDKVLRINEKFRFALRNIAEKQKQSNQIEILKRKVDKSKENTQNESRIQNVKEQIKNDEKKSKLGVVQIQEQKLIDKKEFEKPNQISKLSIQVEEDEQLQQDIRHNEEMQKLNMINESMITLSEGQQTDKIICYSPINTNEEMLDAVVNQSNTFNNEESIIINESNLQQSRIDDSQNQIQVLSYEKEQHQHSFYLEEEFKKERQVKSEESETDVYLDRQILSQKPILRLMFGNEKFLLENEGIEGIEGNYFGSPISSQRLMQSENPYFLATNASIFERNPFKEFTTNKLHEVLAGKDIKDLVEMKEDALKYQERLEKGFINRLEKRSELSPKSSQRKKYELESWVNSERKRVQQQKDHPLNMFDLEYERREAAKIIEQVNSKVKDIKSKLNHDQKSSQFSNDNIDQYDQIQEIKDGDTSNSKLNISVEIEQIEEKKIPDLEVIENKGQINTEEAAGVELEISFIEEDEDEEYMIRKQEKEKQEQVERLTQMIFEEFIRGEAENMIIRREKSSDLSNSSPITKINTNEFQQIQYELITTPEQKDHKEEKQQSPSHFLNEKYINERNMIIKPSPIIEQMQQSKPTGLDTTVEATNDYIEEIFSQIKMRRVQFLQAFATPIYKNPLEVLNNLQKPEFGELEMTMEMTSSLSCILNVQLYLTLEKARENIIQETISQIKKQNLSLTPNGNQLTEDELVDLITESQHIHNKVIFDCINEALNQVRPYGNQGEPMPWSIKARKNLQYIYENTATLQLILDKVISKVTNWAKSKAGALPPRQYEYNQLNMVGTFDEESFTHQREKCLAQLLAQDLLESEEKWLDYEMEETQVKIDLSDIILEQLVGETCEILNSIQKNKHQ